MKTINISISDSEFNKFGLTSSTYAFSDLVDRISRELIRQKLSETTRLADKYGLSAMGMDEITKEVKAVRKNAKGHY
jgi:hypothetical protein